MPLLPRSTHLSRQLPKKTIFEQFKLNAAQRQRIDADIARLAPDTLPAIATGQEIAEIWVLALSLKAKGYHPDSLKLLARLIPQQILFVLYAGQEAQLVIIHQGLHTSPWQPKEEVSIPIEGLNFDTVWEHLVASIGSISLSEGRILEERIQQKQERQQLQRDIALLEGRISKERSLGKQMQLRTQINQIKRRIETEYPQE